MVHFELLNLLPVFPEITVTLAALVLLLLGAFKGNEYFSSQVYLSVGFVALAVFWLFLIPDYRMDAFGMTFVHNGFTSFCKILVLVSCAFVMMLSAGAYRTAPADATCEFPIVMLLAVVGMMVMISANSLLVLYMGLELQSLALYILAAFHRNNLKSSEAGLKYFVLGSLSSGLLLYGISLIYGFAGTIGFADLGALLTSGDKLSLGVLVGMIFVMVGILFKISAVPFHMWTPDVYEGSPISVTVFFATAPKVAAVALLIRVLQDPFGGLVVQWQQIIQVVAVITMIVGALGAIRQTNIKRLLAYSSIGHVGYILVAVAASSRAGVSAVLIYLAIYVVMSLGIFACIMLLRTKENSFEDIGSFAGLSKTKPLVAFAIAVMMFSMAGIPPLAGFFGKFFVFKAAIDKGLIALALIGVISSVIAAFYYLRIVKVLYFDEASVPVTREFQPEIKYIALFATVFNFLFFIKFTPLVSMAENAATSLF